MTTTDERYWIDKRTPDVDALHASAPSTGLTPFSRTAAEIRLEGTVFAVVVVVDGQVIGMGRLIGDGGCFFQVTDVAVQPDHQGRGLGKAIMTAIMEYVNTTLPETAYVSLIADVPANKLYEQFGFKETASGSVGMSFMVR